MRSQDLLKSMNPLFPADFFLCNVEVSYGKDLSKALKTASLLPDFSILLGEESVASCSLVWNEEGVMGRIIVEKPLDFSFFPDYMKGDAIEIFIDTRDNKKAGFTSRFCHQFVFLPLDVEGVIGSEITKFRPEDSHPLCDPALLSATTIKGKKEYTLIFMLPKEVLYSYDPKQFSRIGFAYRIHRYKGAALHFPFSSDAFEPLKNPALWASISLI